MISTVISSLEISDIFSLLMVITITYVTQYYYRYFTRPNPLPGPLPFPILGNIPQQIGYEYKDWLIAMHKKYGDMFELALGGMRTIMLCRTDLIENMNIPSTKTNYLIRFPFTEGFTEYGLSDSKGITNNIKYNSWKYNRQFFTQATMTPSFNNQSTEWAIELWKEMESYWNNLGENHELDISNWARRFTNEMIYRISTGVKNNSIASYYHTLISKAFNEKEREKIEKSEKFVQSINTYMSGFMYFFAFNKFMRHYAPFVRGKVSNLLKNKDYLFDILHDIIKERRIEIENTPLGQPLRHDTLTSYLTANTSRDINVTKNNADVRPMNDEEIFVNILDTMIAGTDTTANLFSFVVYYLGHYPEVKQRLQEEFDEVLGKDLTRPTTYKDFEELRYCDAVIKEVQRHCPVVPAIGRINAEKDKVGGFDWPEKTSFQILYSAMMKHKDYWTDPEKFDPDRFYKVEESDKYLLEKQHIKNSFTIFGGGIRICPGKKLAMIELRLLLSSIYRKYDVELVDMNAPLKCKSGFVTLCEELIVKVKPRNLR